MSIATSSTMTQEFVQMLSGELLYAPDTEFVFAALAHASRDEAFEIAQMMGERGADGFEAAMRSSGRPDDSRAAEVGAGFCKVVQGPETPGLTALIDRPIYANGDYDMTARALTEGTPIGTTFLAPSMGQVSVTMGETGGPYNGSTITPLAITSVLKNRAKHDLVKYLGKLLRRDRNAGLDATIRNLLLTTSHTSTPASVATASMTAGGSPMTDAFLAQVLLNLQKRNVRPFPNGRYMLTIDPQHFKDLRADSAFREMTRYPGAGAGPDGQSPPVSGYLLSYGGFDVVQSTNITHAAVGSGGAVTGYQALAFGPESLGWAIGLDAHAERSKNDDYARQDSVVWLAIEGFALLNDALVEKLITS